MVDRLFKKYTNVILLILSLLILSCDSGSITGLGEGKEKLLVIKESNHYSEIGTMNPDGSGYRKLLGYSTLSPNRSIDYAELSPDRQMIVFSGGPGEAIHDHNVWLTNISGNVIDRLAYYGRRPTWSGDGKKIYYTRYRGSTTYLSDVYVYDFVSNVKVDISAGSDCNDYEYCKYYYEVADVNPFNNSEIIINEKNEFVKDDRLYQGDYNFVFFETLSNTKTFVTNELTLREVFLKISPSNLFIIYTTYDTSNGNVSSFNLSKIDGSGLRILQTFEDKIYHESFAWSPDGKKIAVSKSNYIHKDKPLSNIYIIDPESGEEEQITFEEDRSTLWNVMQWFINEK